MMSKIQSCIINAIEVEVWVGAVFDCRTFITGFTVEAINVSDGKYLRENCGLRKRNCQKTNY